MHFASTSSGSTIFINSPDGEMQILTHLFRVRRLLEIGRETPMPVSEALNGALRQALEEWPEAYREEKAHMRQIEEQRAKGQGGPAVSGVRWERVRQTAMVATYVLAELQQYGSLPLLVESHELQLKWESDNDSMYVAPCPVPPAITLYAIHRLVSGYPQAGLTGAARAAQEKYITWAGKNLPPLTELPATAPSSRYDESDPKLLMMDPERVVLRDEPTMLLYSYPHLFADGSWMQHPFYPRVEGKSKEWFGLMKSFADLTTHTESLLR